MFTAPGNNLTTREHLLNSLNNDDERAVVARVEGLARRPDLRFFHWEIEFPEVFFGFADSEQRQIKHKNGIDAGSAGFDAVVGNPPYALLQGRSEQDALRDLNPSFHSGSDDILYYFMKLQVEVLRLSGSGSFIVSRYWMESKHAENLREFVTSHCDLTHLVDFRNFQPFGDDVHILCCIPCLRTGRQKRDATIVRFEDFFAGDLTTVARILVDCPAFLPEDPRQCCSFQAPQTAFTAQPWFVSPPEVDDLLLRVEENCIRLGQIARYTQGVKTGLNNAFIVNAEYAHEEGLEPALLLPIVKGRAVFPFFIQDERTFLIYAHGEIAIGDFPRIKRHLAHFRERLQARAECNSGLYPWWRLQRPRDPSIILSKKIMCPLYATYNRFGLSARPPYAVGVTDTCAFAIDEPEGLTIEYVTGILNSSVAQFFHKRRAKLKRASYYEYFVEVLDGFPIPTPSRNVSAASRIEECVARLIVVQRGSRDHFAASDELNEAVFDLCGFRGADRRMAKRLASARPGNEEGAEAEVEVEEVAL